MNYEVKFYKDAMKSIQKLDTPTRNRILDHINILSENPRHPELDIKKMQGIDNRFRLRVGSYRIVFSVFNDQLLIVIEAPRREYGVKRRYCLLRITHKIMTP